MIQLPSCLELKERHPVDSPEARIQAAVPLLATAHYLVKVGEDLCGDFDLGSYEVDERKESNDDLISEVRTIRRHVRRIMGQVREEIMEIAEYLNGAESLGRQSVRIRHRLTALHDQLHKQLLAMANAFDGRGLVGTYYCQLMECHLAHIPSDLPLDRDES